jgi:acetyl-CoA carboxylase carboxyl transferase subunit beta
MRKLFSFEAWRKQRDEGEQKGITGYISKPKVCASCSLEITDDVFYANNGACPSCGTLFRLGAYERIRLTVDKGTFEELFGEMISDNKLNFPEYEEKLEKSMKASGLNEAVVTGVGEIEGQKTAVAVMDPNFMMGSMGTVVGEKIVSLVEYARELKLPVIIFCASGGARMQEGMHSLMQMTRCSVALKRHSEDGLLYISVLTHPTTGGVSASFAMQGDIIISEPGALIGFAGKGVIEGTIKQKLPDTFQKAEFLLEHGFLDAIIERSELKSKLAWFLKTHSSEHTEREGKRWIF